jgi:hypothetical protein
LGGGSLLRSGQTQVGEPKIGEHAERHYFADVEVIRSLSLVHRVLLPRAVCLHIYIYILFLSADVIKKLSTRLRSEE